MEKQGSTQLSELWSHCAFKAPRLLWLCYHHLVSVDFNPSSGASRGAMQVSLVCNRKCGSSQKAWLLKSQIETVALERSSRGLFEFYAFGQPFLKCVLKNTSLLNMFGKCWVLYGHTEDLVCILAYISTLKTSNALFSKLIWLISKSLVF